MTEKQQRVQELNRQIAEMKRELKELEPNSSKKMLLTTVGIIVGTIIAVACFMCFFPLSDDDSVYNASCAAHDAKEELRECQVPSPHLALLCPLPPFRIFLTKSP